jgi:hypothetical protein
MSDEITESAKAVQEVAKTTGQAIKTIEKIGSFFSRIMNESIDATCGMLADTLKFKRWERQLRLIEKTEEIIKSKGFSDTLRPISPKLALPIFHNASMETDESLHDIWANLLATALDPKCEIPRNAYVDIIRQLEPVDVKVLNVLHDGYLVSLQKEEKRRKEFAIKYPKRTIKYDEIPPTNFSCSQYEIINRLQIDVNTYWISIDNLIRQRLASTYIEETSLETDIDDIRYDHDVSYGK